MRQNMEILDCFCGIGPWSTRDGLLPATPEETLALMDHFGVARALVYGNLATQIGWWEDANAVVAAAARRNPRFIPAIVPRPPTYRDSPSIEAQMKAMRRIGAKAVALQLPGRPQLRGLWTWLTGDLLAACCAHRLPVLLNIEEKDWGPVDDLCTAFPELRLILTGVAYTNDDVLYPLLRRHASLRVCLAQSYIPEAGLPVFLRHFGVERILFGSGFPAFSPGGLIGHVMYAPIGRADKARILGGNLMRLIEEVRL
jgi:predicted TIM-barrel fold metal-dependent hydrolase